MARWRRLTKAGGVAAGLTVGTLAAGAGVVIAAEKIAAGRLRLRPDPAAGEPLGQLRDPPVIVTADDGVPLHVEVSGPDDAPVTIVFSHGYTLSRDVWHYQRQALAGQPARLVFWDQRGHGLSGRGDPAHSVIGQLGADLAAVLDATVPAGGSVVLVGHSMGGMTIMALAGQRPGLFGPGAGPRVVATVLISTAASGIDPAQWLPGPLRWAGRQATPAVLRGAARGRSAALVERARAAGGDVAFWSTRYLAFGDPGPSPALVGFLERVIAATPIEVVAEFYEALTRLDQEAGLAILGQVPCLVLTGERDRLVASGLTSAMAARIPGARLTVVPGAGHALILECPEVVTGAIEAVLPEALPGVLPEALA